LWRYLYCARRRRSRLLRLEAALQTSDITKIAGGIIVQFLLMRAIISARILNATADFADFADFFQTLINGKIQQRDTNDE